MWPQCLSCMLLSYGSIIEIVELHSVVFSKSLNYIMNILLIDYLSPSGHKFFNTIHVNALLELGHKVCLVGKDGQFKNFEKSQSVNVQSIPKWMFVILPFPPLMERLLGIIRLLWLLLYVDKKKYNSIIFLSYDVLSLFVYRVASKVYLINHNNVSQIDKSKLKLFFTKFLPSNYIHVALNEMMEKRLKELLPNKTIVFVPHGFIRDEGEAKKPTYLQEGEHFLFCPINNNYDPDFVGKLFCDCKLQEFLSTHNIKLIVKRKLLGVLNHTSLIGIEGRFSNEEYRYLMRNALAVVLPYSSQFKYRCSGIFFECVANESIIISTRIPDMEIYSGRVKICYFKTPMEFIDCVKSIKGITVEKEPLQFCEVKNCWNSILM